MPRVHMHTVTYTSWPGSHFGIGDEPSLASLEARDTLCANLLSSTLPELYACRAASRSRVAPLLRCLTVEGASGDPGMANKLQRHTEGAQWASNAFSCSTLTWLKWLCCVKGVVLCVLFCYVNLNNVQAERQWICCITKAVPQSVHVRMCMRINRHHGKCSKRYSCCLYQQ